MALLAESKTNTRIKKSNRSNQVRKALKRGLRRLSGTYYDDIVAKHKIAETTDIRYSSKEKSTGAFDSYHKVFGWDESQDKYKNLFEREYTEKRKTFRKLAIQPVVMEILEIITMDAIVKRKKANFCNVTLNKDKLGRILKPEILEKFEGSVIEIFDNIMSKLGFLNTEEAQGKFMEFLVDGKVAYEIVYNAKNPNNATEILEILPLDPLCITVEPQGNGETHYIYKNGIKSGGDGGEDRILKEENIIYLDYSDMVKGLKRTAYIERLIKPYNIYRIMEQTKIIWHVTNSSQKVKYTIPTKGQNEAEMEQTLGTAMQSFNEKIEFDGDSGEISVNGRPNLQFTDQFWSVSTDSGEFDIDIMNQEGHDLSNFEDLMFWIRRLYRIANVPITRYDMDASESWVGADPESMSEQERRFIAMLDSLQNMFAKIILKPLIIQLILLDPTIQYDQELIDSIDIEYFRNTEREDRIFIERLQHRVGFIEEMREAFQTEDADGNVMDYFSKKWLIKRFLGLTEKELKENKELLDKEIQEMHEFSEKKARMEAEIESEYNNDDDTPFNEDFMNKFNKVYEMIMESRIEDNE